MSFQRRNIGISPASINANDSSSSRTGPVSPSLDSPSLPSPIPVLGSRPSPLDGRPTTSTGTSTLDSLLAGHAGLPLGTSLLIEESGTTDYAGALLRLFAAEGLVQGHRLHVVGGHERWGRELPGLIGGVGKQEEGLGRNKGQEGKESERMKIAWRYESLGQAEGSNVMSSRDPVQKQRKGVVDSPQVQGQSFCHIFDLRKRLEHPLDASISFLDMSPNANASPFISVLEQLHSDLETSPNAIHRLVIPSLLSPQAFPPHSSLPHHVLQFLKGIRALLSLYPSRFVAMITLPLSLFPRASGLVRWIELLSDGVMELAPFPHSHNEDPVPRKPASRDAESDDEPPQGLLQIHRLPIFHERGVGTNAVADDWAFSLSRRRFAIKPYSLPPVGGDTEAQQGGPNDSQQPKKSDMEF